MDHGRRCLWPHDGSHEVGVSIFPLPLTSMIGLLDSDENHDTDAWIALQELIAPSYVTFCSRAWNTIGSKVPLRQPLSRITGIDQLVLVDSGLLPSYTIAKRMSWAAHRSTTRGPSSCMFLVLKHCDADGHTS